MSRAAPRTARVPRAARWHEQPSGELVLSVALLDGRVLRVAGGRRGRGRVDEVERQMMLALIFERAQDLRRQVRLVWNER